MVWLDSLDECGAVSDGDSSSSNEALPSSPTSDSSLASDFPLPDQEWAPNRPCSPDLIFPFQHGSPVESGFSQDAGEFYNLPSPMPIHMSLVDCQLISKTGLPCPNRGSAAEAKGASSSDLLSPLNNSEISPGSQEPRVKRRKRIQARPVEKSSGNATDANGTPAAETGKIDKAYLRGCHNKVEKNYRDRLNEDFNMLLQVVSDYMDERELVSAGLTVEGSRSQSKGSILRLARWKLQALKAENCIIAGELEMLRQAWAPWPASDMTKPPRHRL